MDAEPIWLSNRYSIHPEGYILNHRRKRPIYGTPNNAGYLLVGFDEKTALISRLIAQSFVINDDPINKKYVNHKDHNPANNRADNLEWVTCSENNRHRRRRRHRATSVGTQTD